MRVFLINKMYLKLKSQIRRTNQKLYHETGFSYHNFELLLSTNEKILLYDLELKINLARIHFAFMREKPIHKLSKEQHELFMLISKSISIDKNI